MTVTTKKIPRWIQDMEEKLAQVKAGTYKKPGWRRKAGDPPKERKFKGRRYNYHQWELDDSMRYDESEAFNKARVAAYAAGKRMNYRFVAKWYSKEDYGMIFRVE